MDDVNAAKLLISSLDLTSLNEDDTPDKISRLCEKAQTPYGNVAAVCVYPQFVAQSKEELKNTDIKIATVINFPHGTDSLEQIQIAITGALLKGADELDVVFPYHDFITGQHEQCAAFVKAVKTHVGKRATLKIILETGEIKKTSLISQASRLCIDSGANFLKTSTGKTEISATPEAANIILDTIASGRRNVGFKASGGIKTIDDAKKYLVLANAIMGGKWLTPKNFRIGASSLLDDLLTVIERGY